jgi:C4-dicarboxylate transporter, DctM subunit
MDLNVIMPILMLLGVLILCLLLRITIFVSTLIAAAVTLLVYFRGPFEATLSNLSIQSTYNWTLTAIPLFVLMGTLMSESGLSNRMFNGLAPLCSRIPGGLVNVNVIFSAIFGAMCGSGSAAVAAVTTVVYPEFKKRPQYRMSEVLGSIAASSNLGPIIPPSLILIIYGGIVGESVGKLFVAGIIPGILLALLFIGWIMFNSFLKHDKNLEPKASLKQIITAPVQMYPAVILIVLAIGTIYLGIATPSEAAGLGAAGALVLGLIYKDLTWKKLKSALRSAVEVSAMMAVIMLSAKLYGFAASYLNIPTMLANAIIEANLSPYVFMLMIFALAVLLDMIGAELLVLIVVAPMIYPIVQEIGGPFGLDGIWLGIYILLINCLGVLTPPIAAAVFLVSAITKEKPELIFKGTFPYMIINAVFVVAIIFLPWIATWLPSTMISK